MYLAIIVLLMAVLPVLSIVAEAALSGGDLLVLVGKWFVFWAVGIRLMLAGVKQAANPGFTATGIFGVEDHRAFIIVQELGFANFSIGTLGVLSLFNPGWVVPSATAGGLFYGLAGARHALKKDRNQTETIAMISDLLLFLVLALFLCLHFVKPA